MAEVWSRYHVVLLLTAALLPVAALLAWLRHRRRGVAGVAEVAAGYGTLPWVAMILTPNPGTPSRVNLVPLHDFVELARGPVGETVIQVVGNVLVFAAAGFFLPVRFPALRSVPRMLALGAAGSAVLEVAQYVLRLGRVSSVDDVLVNALGAALFALASRPWWRRLPAGP